MNATDKKITVEISLYPLTEDYVSKIKDFIARIKKYKELEVLVNATSTQIVGDHFKVFDILAKETAITFENGDNIFVMKVVGEKRDIKKYLHPD